MDLGMPNFQINPYLRIEKRYVMSNHIDGVNA